MKVPKYIREAIIKNAKANEVANQTDRIIRDWLVKNKILNDHVIDIYLDNCDNTNVPENFIELLEEGAFRKGNDSWYCEDED
ncbi:hypothetical protein [Brevibacillus laterosporus]|uniref:hypothetical protein n=1 Tax=Brevibacillus laterosporus TaxID=1465 RepID=UPI002E213D4F|nr:hypothetical protein [Brevibacillus laterosporus]MED1667198.1 hypothetical protein [Brevibacillus laterosporus]MED1719734.1 hypothetical protein [Brevibacillus laterosporus]